MATDESVDVTSQDADQLTKEDTQKKSKMMFAVMIMGAIPIIFTQTAIRICGNNARIDFILQRRRSVRHLSLL